MCVSINKQIEMIPGDKSKTSNIVQYSVKSHRPIKNPFICTILCKTWEKNGPAGSVAMAKVFDFRDTVF